VSSRSFECDREGYELELELDDSDSASEPVSDDDSDPDDEPGSEWEEADARLADLATHTHIFVSPKNLYRSCRRAYGAYRFVRFLAGSLPLSLSRCFSFAAKIRSAVPLLKKKTSYTKNKSATDKKEKVFFFVERDEVCWMGKSKEKLDETCF
jgi:hypothetical protein